MAQSIYKKTLFYSIKASAPEVNDAVLELFFKSWVDEVCNNGARCKINKYTPVATQYRNTFCVEFPREEDALMMKLKGLPSEFENYIVET